MVQNLHLFVRHQVIQFGQHFALQLCLLYLPRSLSFLQEIGDLKDDKRCREHHCGGNYSYVETHYVFIGVCLWRLRCEVIFDFPFLIVSDGSVYRKECVNDAIVGEGRLLCAVFGVDELVARLVHFGWVVAVLKLYVAAGGH